MGRVTYSAIASLDGYVADDHGRFEWAAPDKEVHSFVNALERPVGTYLYGRCLYDVMAAWKTMPTDDQATVIGDFARTWTRRPLCSCTAARLASGSRPSRGNQVAGGYLHASGRDSA